jgi:hypothetical protein
MSQHLFVTREVVISLDILVVLIEPCAGKHWNRCWLLSLLATSLKPWSHEGVEQSI